MDIVVLQVTIQQADGLCNPGILQVASVDQRGGLVLADMPTTLYPVAETAVKGWGSRRDDDQAKVYRSERCAWSALISRSELHRLGLA